MTQPQALAEAVLYYSLQSQRTLRAFCRAAELDGRSNIVDVDRQPWSDDLSARHDLVLYSETGRPFRIELKGFAPLTARQKRALRRGPEEREGRRIDVLIVPSSYVLPEQIHPMVRIVSWEQVDRVLRLDGVGKLADLWARERTFERDQIVRTARDYVAWKTRQGGEDGWNALWEPLARIKSRLPRLHARKIDGSRRKASVWQYGMAFSREKGGDDWWLGWVFKGGRKGPLRIVFLLSGDETLPKGLRRALPDWCEVEDGTGRVYWDGDSGIPFDTDLVIETLKRLGR